MKTRGYVFTIYNWDSDTIQWVSKLLGKATYGICGKEICPTTNRPHLQCYGYWENGKHFESLLKQGKGIDWHLEAAKGTAKQNQKYCSKEGDFEEWGECPEGQGHRSDISDFRDAILDGMLEEELIMLYPNMMAKYDRFYQRCRNIVLKREAKKMIQPEVIVIQGDTGVGKTHTVYLENNIDDIYKAEVGDGSSGSVFWDNYNGESVILIDDFHNNLKLDYMLRLLDKYPMKLNVKGGHTWKCAKKIYITTNININSWYRNCPEIHRKALLRRVTNIIDMFNHQPLCED